MEAVEPIEIHEYSPGWATEFQQIGARLRKALGDVAFRIDHIGSTSVEGLAAKPIIDVQISVRRLEPVIPFLAPMEGLGYIRRRNNPEKTKRYFREAPGRRRTHIHIRKAGSWHEQFALLFRDYIRVHPEDQGRYEAVKRELAVIYRLERRGYTAAKDAIVWEVMHRADRWAAHTGWEPGASDV
jgi:GrpB-like predicted nucleotidyltransferase (UPF0157 family)